MSRAFGAVVVAVGVVGVVYVVGVAVVAVVIVVVLRKTMDLPTDATLGSPKRVRVDPTATNTPPDTKNPLVSAHAHIQDHVSSLLPQTATILSRCARQHLQYATSIGTR